MASYDYTTINKYGKEVFMPKTEKTRPEMTIASVLEDIGIHSTTENADGLRYQMGYFFDETGLRRKKYDLAVLKHNEPKLLIEYDGNSHYDETFYKDTGVRPERCTAHVVRAGISEAIKAAVAFSHNVPYVRVNEEHMPHIRDLIIAYVEVIVNGSIELKNVNNEVAMIDMMEKYGWDFPYVPPSDMSKAERIRVQKMKGDKNGSTEN